MIEHIAAEVAHADNPLATLGCYVPADIEAAIAACDDPVLAAYLARFYGLSLSRDGDFARALDYGLFAYERVPRIETLQSIGMMAERAGDVFHAVDFLLAEYPKWPDDFCLNDVLCTNLGWFADMAQAIPYGEKSLQLKDALTRHVPPVDYPPRRAFNVADRARNVVAFSLFGRDPRYCETALLNAKAMPSIYPAWMARFYVDDSVPLAVVRQLEQADAQVIAAPAEYPAADYGLFWRFLALADDSVDFCLVRDADSLISARESAAVADWLASGCHFHVMRDWFTHSELILAGMWGGVGQVLTDLPALMRQHIEESDYLLDTGSDQRFLRERIWPLIRTNVLQHDRLFRATGGVAFPTVSEGQHVGQNEYLVRQVQDGEICLNSS